MRHVTTTATARIALLSAALLAVPAAIVVGDPGGGGQRGPHPMGPGHPTTDRAMAPGERPGFMDRDHGPMRGGDRGGGGMAEFDKFREDLQQFLIKHSPNRWAAMNDSARGGGGGSPVKFGGMFFRYRGLVVLKNEDPELYDIKVRQIEIEDQEFGLMRQLREAKKDDKAEDVDRITKELRKYADEYVTKRFEERTRRVAKLEKVLADEKAALASERDRKDALIGQHVEAVLHDQPTHRPFGPGPGGPGGPGGGPGGPGGPPPDKDDAPSPPPAK
jgi:hypothetical protein